MKGSIGSKILSVSISALVLTCGCQKVDSRIHPQLAGNLTTKTFKKLPSPFEPLSENEQSSEWGKELKIGKELAKNFDLYRAITALKRAEILTPEEKKARTREIQYGTLLSYYLGKKYQQVDHTFSQSGLREVGPDFPVYHDLLVILFDTYRNLDYPIRAGHILEIMERYDPDAFQKLALSSAISSGDLPALKTVDSPQIKQLVANYEGASKSPRKAALYNGLLPGLGYVYIGQLQTAITAFFMNGLFIWAMIHFFRKRAIALALILLGFEIGWYVGGIDGASRGATTYNERVYEALALPIMHSEGLFPINMLKKGL